MTTEFILLFGIGFVAQLVDGALELPDMPTPAQAVKRTAIGTMRWFRWFRCFTCFTCFTVALPC